MSHHRCIIYVMSLPCSSYGTNYSGTCTLFEILLAFDPAMLSDQELDGTEAWVTDDEQRIKRASKNCKRNASVPDFGCQIYCWTHIKC